MPLLNDISRTINVIDKQKTSLKQLFLVFLRFSDFYGFSRFYIFVFSFWFYKIYARICEANPLLLIVFLKTFERFWSETLHAKTWENEFKAFSW